MSASYLVLMEVFDVGTTMSYKVDFINFDSDECFQLQLFEAAICIWEPCMIAIVWRHGFSCNTSETWKDWFMTNYRLSLFNGNCIVSRQITANNPVLATKETNILALSLIRTNYQSRDITSGSTIQMSLKRSSCLDFTSTNAITI